MTFEPIDTIIGPASSLLRANIDTDVIIRVDRMTSTDPAELAPFAFEALRYRPDGTENPDYARNDHRFRDAPILITGANFGCGSSREPAVWAIVGIGVRCVIAPSFGDIFSANCAQNGVLAIVLDAADISALAAIAADGGPLTVDLQTQTVRTTERSWTFDIGQLQKTALLNGLDDLELAMQEIDAIRVWEADDRTKRPWAWTATRQLGGSP
jgi:3-isopropylmalate/(R)-2-methylmalate dehydratase small subunit